MKRVATSSVKVRAVLPSIVKDRPTLIIVDSHIGYGATIDRTKYASASGLARGAYILADAPANKVVGVRAALCHDDYSSRQGVEDDNVNVLCLGGRTLGIAVAWGCVKNFLGAKFSGAERHRRRLAKVLEVEASSLTCASESK